jgi:hypothetical protein
VCNERVQKSQGEECARSVSEKEPGRGVCEKCEARKSQGEKSGAERSDQVEPERALMSARMRRNREKRNRQGLADILRRQNMRLRFRASVEWKGDRSRARGRRRRRHRSSRLLRDTDNPKEIRIGVTSWKPRISGVARKESASGYIAILHQESRQSRRRRSCILPGMVQRNGTESSSLPARDASLPRVESSPGRKRKAFPGGGSIAREVPARKGQEGEIRTEVL